MNPKYEINSARDALLEVAERLRQQATDMVTWSWLQVLVTSILWLLANANAIELDIPLKNSTTTVTIYAKALNISDCHNASAELYVIQMENKTDPFGHPVFVASLKLKNILKKENGSDLGFSVTMSSNGTYLQLHFDLTSAPLNIHIYVLQSCPFGGIPKDDDEFYVKLQRGPFTNELKRNSNSHPCRQNGSIGNLEDIGNSISLIRDESKLQHIDEICFEESIACNSDLSKIVCCNGSPISYFRHLEHLGMIKSFNGSVVVSCGITEIGRAFVLRIPFNQGSVDIPEESYYTTSFKVTDTNGSLNCTGRAAKQSPDQFDMCTEINVAGNDKTTKVSLNCNDLYKLVQSGKFYKCDENIAGADKSRGSALTVGLAVGLSAVAVILVIVAICLCLKYRQSNESEKLKGCMCNLFDC